MSAATVFWELAAELQAENPDVVEGTIMKGRGLRARGEFVAPYVRGERFAFSSAFAGALRALVD